MPAVVLTGDGRIALQDRPRPTVRPDQVLVEVDMCGICGSDLHASQLPQVYRRDCILGHESTGRVAAVGDEVSDWAVGEGDAGPANETRASLRDSGTVDDNPDWMWRGDLLQLNARGNGVLRSWLAWQFRMRQ